VNAVLKSYPMVSMRDDHGASSNLPNSKISSLTL
jgi:hypothetical protein